MKLRPQSFRLMDQQPFARNFFYILAKFYHQWFYKRPDFILVTYIAHIAWAFTCLFISLRHLIGEKIILESYNDTGDVIFAFPRDCFFYQLLGCLMWIFYASDRVHSFLVWHHLLLWIQYIVKIKFQTLSHKRSALITFQIPSLAKTMNSVSSSIVWCVMSGSELRCIFKLLSPNALATASCPSTLGTSPVTHSIQGSVYLNYECKLSN